MKKKKEIERQEQLYQLGTLVAGAFSLHEVLDKLAEAAVKIVNVKACAIRLLDEDAGELTMRSTYGLSEEYRNKGPVSKNDTVIKAAFDGLSNCMSPRAVAAKRGKKVGEIVGRRESDAPAKETTDG